MASLVTLLVTLTSCKDGGTRSSESPAATPGQSLTEQLSLAKVLDLLGEGVGEASGGVQDALGPQGEALHEKTRQEVEKLFRWEYKVIDLPPALSAGDLEGRLDELGREGWECFSITPTQTATRATCKRRPKSAITYLKLLPGL